MIPVIYRYTIPVIYRYMYLLDVDVCRPSLLKNTTSRILFSFDCCLTSLENFFTNGDVNVIICLDLYTVSFFLRSSTIVCDIYTCCRALRTVATFTCFKTRVFHHRNCHNRPSDLRDERSNKMRRRCDKTKG